MPIDPTDFGASRIQAKVMERAGILRSRVLSATVASISNISGGWAGPATRRRVIGGQLRQARTVTP